jgi:membrane protease YdiL (CAAX protease family)
MQARHSALKASLIIGILWAPWHLPLWLLGRESNPISLFVPFALAVIASSVIYTWLFNNTGGSLLIIVLYHAASNLPITVLISPLGSQMAQPFLIYVALTVVAAVVVVITTGAENLSRSAHRQIEQP